MFKNAQSLFLFCEIYYERHIGNSTPQMVNLDLSAHLNRMKTHFTLVSNK